jgi:hypothetical protein
MNRVDRHHSHSPLSLGQCAGQRNCSSASGLSVPCRRSCLHSAGVKIGAQPADQRSSAAAAPATLAGAVPANPAADPAPLAEGAPARHAQCYRHNRWVNRRVTAPPPFIFRPTPRGSAADSRGSAAGSDAADRSPLAEGAPARHAVLPAQPLGEPTCGGAAPRYF